MKKIIIIILLAVGSVGITGFTLAKKGTNFRMTKTTEELNPLPDTDKLGVVNLVNDEQWN